MASRHPMSPPPAKKQLFSHSSPRPTGSTSQSPRGLFPSQGGRAPSPARMSASPRSQQSQLSPQSSPRRNKGDLAGFLMLVGEVQKGSSNRYFDIKLNVARGEHVKIKVMLMNLKTKFEDHVNQAVKLTNVSLPNEKNNCYFYNEKFGSTFQVCPYSLSFAISPTVSVPVATLTNDTVGGFNVKGLLRWVGPIESANNSQVRPGVLKDTSGTIRIAVWKEQMITTLQDGGKFVFSDMNTGLFSAYLQFGTSPNTVIMKTDDPKLPETIDDLDDYIVKANSEELINPTIVTASMTMQYGCRNKKCLNIFDLPPPTSDLFPRCLACNHKCARANLIVYKQCTLVVEIENDEVHLNVSEEVLKSCSSLSNITAHGDIENRLLMMTNRVKLQVDMEQNCVLAIEEEQGSMDDDEFASIDWSDNQSNENTELPNQEDQKSQNPEDNDGQ